jgi:hypothetical protein
MEVMQPEQPYSPGQPGQQPMPAPAPPPGQLPTPVQPPAGPNPDYGFIMSPEATPPKRKLPGANSLLAKIVIVAGALILLLIIFSVVRGLLKGSNNFPEYTSLAQDQQSMVHITTDAANQTSISTTNKNFAVTAQTSLSSDQTQILKYLAQNKVKVKQKTLNQKIDPAVDKQLDDAVATNSYDSTFKQVMQAKLTAYTQKLKSTYNHTKGKHGRQLLSQEYANAQLLIDDINSPF